MKSFYYLLIFLLGGSAMAVSGKTTIVYVPEKIDEPRNTYFTSLLALALEKTATTEQRFEIAGQKAQIVQSRAINLLSRTLEIDVLWTMTSIEREQILLPIRIPLVKGLLGYRVLLIRADDQARFTHITRLEQLQKLRAGQGHDWPDTQILKANQMKVETTSSYEGLFGMLKANRFDYFPRGINEVQAELATFGDQDLAIENSLLLYYRSPIYFFVAPANHELAARIERGLRIAIADGSFDQQFSRHFNGHLDSNNHFKLDILAHRKRLTLTNPLLPPLTPIDDGTLWYQD